MSTDKDKDREIKEWNNGDKTIVEHQDKEGKVSYSQWAEGHTGGDFEPGNL